MPEVSVGMILSDNLKLKFFKVKQQEIILAIEGDTDPNTLQKLRDFIVQSVTAHRTAINDFIKNKNEAVGKAQPNKRNALLKEANTGLKALLEKAEAKMQASADKFYRADEALKNKYTTGRIKLVTRLLWVPITWVADSIVEAVVGTVAGPVGWLLTLKGIADKVKDVATLAGEIKSAYEAKQVDAEKLKTAIADIRKIKPPATLTATQVDKLKIATKAFSARVLGLEMDVKKAATELDGLLKSLENAEPPEGVSLKPVEDLVTEQIENIQKLNEDIKEGKKLVQSATDVAKNAESKAEKDWKGYLGAVGKVYEAVSSMSDFVSDITNWGKAAADVTKYVAGLIVDAKAGD